MSKEKSEALVLQWDHCDAKECPLKGNFINIGDPVYEQVLALTKAQKKSDLAQRSILEKQKKMGDSLSAIEKELPLKASTELVLDTKDAIFDRLFTVKDEVTTALLETKKTSNKMMAVVISLLSTLLVLLLGTLAKILFSSGYTTGM